MTASNQKAAPAEVGIRTSGDDLLQSVALAVAALPAFAESPPRHPVSPLLRRIAAAATISRLRVVFIVAQEAAEVARCFEEESLANLPSNQKPLRAGLLALQQYVHAAVAGEVNSGVLLYPAYAGLADLLPYGRRLTRGELFLPTPPVYQATPGHDASRFEAEARRWGEAFARAHARFGADRSIENLHSMRGAAAAMDAKRPPPNFRVFIELVLCFIDGVIARGAEPHEDEQDLLDRIALDMSEAAAGVAEVPDTTISWLLHALARSPVDSPVSLRFREQYDLLRLGAHDDRRILDYEELGRARAAAALLGAAWSGMVKCGDAHMAATSAATLLASAQELEDPPLTRIVAALARLARSICDFGLEVDPQIAAAGTAAIAAAQERIEHPTEQGAITIEVAELHATTLARLAAGRDPFSEGPHERIEPDRDFQVDACDDEELRPLFCEEARLIVENRISPALIKLANKPTHERAFARAQSGFRALKMSCLIVELPHLGALARHAEDILAFCHHQAHGGPPAEMIAWLRALSDFFLGAILRVERGESVLVATNHSERVAQEFTTSGVFVAQPLPLAAAECLATGGSECIAGHSCLVPPTLPAHVPSCN